MQICEYISGTIATEKAMITRRQAIALTAAGAGLLIRPRPTLAAGDEPVLTEDGLWHQTWFLESFLELGDDLQSASDAGKRFAVMWELKGCPYCKETHFVNFARPDITEFVRTGFEILQLNIIGSRIVTDFDGEQMSEKDLARKYQVRFTPTIQFFRNEGELAGLEPTAREATRIQGYLQPDHFLAMFRFVSADAYDTMSFRQWLKSQG
jgi:thioredoxin-related protein